MLASVHGDDFAASGETQSLGMVIDEGLERFFVLKKMPRLGPPELGGTSEGQFTKRTVNWKADMTTHMVKRLCGIVFLTSEKRREG